MRGQLTLREHGEALTFWWFDVIELVEAPDGVSMTVRWICGCPIRRKGTGTVRLGGAEPELRRYVADRDTLILWRDDEAPSCT